MYDPKSCVRTFGERDLVLSDPHPRSHPTLVRLSECSFSETLDAVHVLLSTTTEDEGVRFGGYSLLYSLPGLSLPSSGEIFSGDLGHVYFALPAGSRGRRYRYGGNARRRFVESTLCLRGLYRRRHLLRPFPVTLRSALHLWVISGHRSRSVWVVLWSRT